MRMNTVLKLLAAACCWALLSPVQAQGDPGAGKYAFATCSGCHAVPGLTNAYPTFHVPRLAGQHAEYIVAALQAYRAGQRSHETMMANAHALSDQAMADIGAYLTQMSANGRPGPIWGNPAAGAEKAQQGGCAGCHGPSGNETTAPNFPKLAGQYEDYLIRTLEQYRSGARQQAIMNGIAGPLSDRDIADLAAFYASQTPGLATVYFDGN
jgi:cytochrome c553